MLEAKSAYWVRDTLDGIVDGYVDGKVRVDGWSLRKGK